MEKNDRAPSRGNWPDERLKYCITVSEIEDGAWEWSVTIGSAHVSGRNCYETFNRAVTGCRKWFKKWTDVKIGRSMFMCWSLHLQQKHAARNA